MTSVAEFQQNLYLWTLKYEFRIIATCHWNVLLIFFQLYHHLKAIVSSQAIQKQVAGLIWPAGHVCGPTPHYSIHCLCVSPSCRDFALAQGHQNVRSHLLLWSVWPPTCYVWSFFYSKLDLQVLCPFLAAELQSFILSRPCELVLQLFLSSVFPWHGVASHPCLCPKGTNTLLLCLRQVATGLGKCIFCLFCNLQSGYPFTPSSFCIGGEDIWSL